MKKGFHLVANQLHQRPTTRSVIESCFFMLIGRYISFDKPFSIDLETSSIENSNQNTLHSNGAVLLLAIIEKTVSCKNEFDLELCTNLLNQLVRIKNKRYIKILSVNLFKCLWDFNINFCIKCFYDKQK